MHFDRVVVINLDRRPDRRATFIDRFLREGEGWPFANPMRFPAIDGQRVPKPAWFPYSAGGWGCTKSHLAVYEQALNANQDVFIFEDDAVFAEDAAERLPQFLAAVPDDWDMIYLGGSHHLNVTRPPVPVNDQVLLARGVGCCTAYGIRCEFLRKVYPLLLEAPPQIIDHVWCNLQLKNEWKVYCPTKWIVGQAAGKSDVDEQEHGQRYLEPKKTISFFNSPEAIPGWFTRECGEVYRREALAAIERSGGLAVMAEAGCWLGRSLAYLSDYLLSGELFAWAIDTWQGDDANRPEFATYKGIDVFRGFMDNMKGLQLSGSINVLRKDSIAASHDFISGTLDLVMIDNDHTLGHLRKELPAWWARLAPGGVMLGHDYPTHCGWPDVAVAVREFANALGLSVETEADLWIIRKPADWEETEHQQLPEMAAT